MTTRNVRAVVELAAAHHGVFTRAQAADVDVTDRVLQRLMKNGLFERPRPNVFIVAGSQPTWRQRLTVATLAGNGAVGSHRSAGRLHSLDGLSGSRQVEVTVLRGRFPDGDEVVLHRAQRLAPADITEVDGIAVTSVARTLCDLGAVLDDDGVERALDDALRRGYSMAWILQTLERVHRPGPTGTSRLIRVLGMSDRSGVVPDSWRERVTERLLDNPNLGHVDRQYTLEDSGGEVVARFDMAVVDARVAVEYHSDQWHFGPRRGRGDRRRDLAAARLGWEIIYLDASDHRDAAAAVTAVVDVVERRRRDFRQAG